MHPSPAPSQAALDPDRPSPAPLLLHGRTLVLARALWMGVVTFAVIIFALATVHELSVPVSIRGWPAEALQAALSQLGLSIGFYTVYRFVMEFVTALGFVVLGLFLFWRRSSEWMVLVVSLSLVTFGANWFSDDLPAVLPNWAMPVALLGFITWNCFGLFFVLFPDGRFVPRWTRELWIGGLVLLDLPQLFVPLPAWLDRVSLVAVFGGAVALQVYRYRRVSGPVQRQQAKWLIFGLTVIVAVFGALIGLSLLFSSLDQPGRAAVLYQMAASLLVTLTFLLIPLSIAIAVLRYRLWDIDIIINRTLVYGALTASVAGVYVGLVVALGALFQAEGSLPVSLLATGSVAVLFQPLRDRLQRGVNHLLYGERDEPYRVLTRLSQRLETTLAPDAVLPTVVQTVREALKLPYVAVALATSDDRRPTTEDNSSQTIERTFDIVAAAGTPVQEQHSLPLVYQHEVVGQLLLAPRAPGEPFTPADQQLLTNLARQAGVAASAVRLTSDLQRAREQLVLAREEERRRLRRDLHDGLGPALAAQTLKVGSARALLARDPASADRLLAGLEDDIATALADIRRLVYNLRPPALDELGLLGAIQQQAAQYRENGTGRLNVTIAVPDPLPLLPAAVEVAAYRIAQEALNNVVKHAQAHTCRLQLALTDGLRLEITDDGIGLPDSRHVGVGLHSMRERVEELGGTFVIEAAPGGGTRVCACLPYITLAL
jgi:signal transduction histidine kinase